MSKTATFRAGIVAAYDSKYTGEEPIWDTQCTWDDAKFVKEYERLFTFYAYYLTSKDLFPDVIKYVKKHFSKEEVKLLDSLPEWVVGTAGKLCRAINKGIDVPRVQTLCGVDIHEIVQKDIRSGLRQYGHLSKKASVAEPVADSQKPESIRERFVSNVNSTLGMDFDVMLDVWVKGQEKVEGVNISDRLVFHKIAPSGASILLPRVEKLRKELNAALNKEYEEATVGYAYLSKKGLLNRIAACDEMVANIIKIVSIQKANRKPRIKKIKSAEKQTSRVKIMQASSEFNIKSVSPLTIPTSYKLYAFNTKYSVLSVLVADSAGGFEVRGSGIQKFSDSSYTVRLKKPNDVLPMILSKTQKQLDTFMESVKGKRGVPNGRLNDKTILLRVFSTK